MRRESTGSYFGICRPFCLFVVVNLVVDLTHLGRGCLLGENCLHWISLCADLCDFVWDEDMGKAQPTVGVP